MVVYNGLIGKLFSQINYSIFFLLLFLYQCLFIFWGIDFSDQGWSATFYRYIFSDPESVKYNFPLWLTGIVGGVWLELFPWSGLIGIRILGIMTFTSTLIFVFELLKNDFEKLNIKKGLLLVVLLFGPHWAFAGFHYDSFSALLFVMMTFFLYRGLKLNKSFSIILSGSVLCVNIFARFPNLAGMGIILMIFYFGYLNEYTIKQYIKAVSLFFIGLLLGIVLIFFFMKYLGHTKLYIEMLRDTIDKSKGGGSHGIYNIFSLLFLQYWRFLVYIFYIIIFIILILIMANKLKLKIYLLLPLLILISVYIAVKQNDFMRVNEWHIYSSFILALNCSLLFNKKTTNNKKILTVSGLLMFFLLPFGSGLGFVAFAGLFLFISIPIATENFMNFYPNNIVFFGKLFPLNREAVYVTKKIIIINLLFIAVFLPLYYTYCEENKKYVLKFPVDSEHSKYILTSKERALAINELLQASNRYVSANEYVLAYGQIPMFYYLTDTKPFLYNIWLGEYSLDYFTRLMNKSLSEKKALPVIVRSRVSTWGNWPRDVPEISYSKDTNWNNYFNDFLATNEYKLAWENNTFQILIPKMNKLDDN